MEQQKEICLIQNIILFRKQNFILPTEIEWQFRKLIIDCTLEFIIGWIGFLTENKFCFFI